MFTVIRLCNDAISALHSHRSGKQNFTAQVVLMLLIEASVMSNACLVVDNLKTPISFNFCSKINFFIKKQLYLKKLASNSV